MGAIAIERARFSSRREDVSDPIAVSRLDQNKSSPQRSSRLSGEHKNIAHFYKWVFMDETAVFKVTG
jgi:hypothetical protein